MRGTPPQTHQQFVDYTMLMRPPSIQEAPSFKKNLYLFAQASGLAVNPNKSQVFFVNTPPATQKNILRILGFSRGDFPSKYLGIPLGIGRPKTEEWQELLDRLKQRLSSWVLHTLNFPSRLILVKSILQAMPTYLFSILTTPKVILKQI